VAMVVEAVTAQPEAPTTISMAAVKTVVPAVMVGPLG
jgi:hypothetical protein